MPQEVIMDKIIICSEVGCGNEVQVDDVTEQTVCWVCIVKKIGWDKKTKKQLADYEQSLKERGYA